jgi:peroxiredoxin
VTTIVTNMTKLGTAIGSYAPDFELPGIDGEIHHLSRYLEKFDAVCVVFMCNHCPYVRSYLERLKKLQSEFSDRNVTLIGINPNDATQYPDDSMENTIAYHVVNQLNFPYIRDVTQDVANCFGAQKTPHVFLLDREGVLRYRGAIDDSANDASAVKVSYLHDAIDCLLTGKEIEVKDTTPVGCSIKWRQS